MTSLRHWDPRDRTQRDVSLLIGLLQLILVWRNVLLRQSFHLVRIVLVLFLFLLDNALFQAATLRLSVGRRIERSLLLFAIRPHAHLEVLLLFLFTFQADGDLLGPGILRKRTRPRCFLTDGYFSFGSFRSTQQNWPAPNSWAGNSSTTSSWRCPDSFASCPGSRWGRVSCWRGQSKRVVW
jgi:hypothetical protein